MIEDDSHPPIVCGNTSRFWTCLVSTGCGLKPLSMMVTCNNFLLAEYYQGCPLLDPPGRV